MIPQQDARKALIGKLRQHAEACRQRALSISSGYKAAPWSERARDIELAADVLEALSASSVSSIDLSKLTTTMVGSEWETALWWRQRFLDHDPEIDKPLAPLDPQIVCFLVADCMTMRAFYDAHEMPPSPSQPVETPEERK